MHSFFILFELGIGEIIPYLTSSELSVRPAQYQNRGSRVERRIKVARIKGKKVFQVSAIRRS